MNPWRRSSIHTNTTLIETDELFFNIKKNYFHHFSTHISNSTTTLYLYNLIFSHIIHFRPDRDRAKEKKKRKSGKERKEIQRSWHPPSPNVANSPKTMAQQKKKSNSTTKRARSSLRVFTSGSYSARNMRRKLLRGG